MRVIVVGDVIIDEYVRGSKRGLSAETPTIVANFVEKETFVGGAGLVTRHLLRLGCSVDLLTCGDVSSFDFKDLSEDEERRLDVRSASEYFMDVSRKTRYFVDNYKLLQFDNINSKQHNEYSEGALTSLFHQHLYDADAVVIADNRHGAINKKIAKFIVKECKRTNTTLFVDSQVSQSESNHSWYVGADYMFMNEKEAAAAFGKGFTESDENLKKLSKKFKTQILYKMGPRGSAYVSEDNVFRFPPHVVNAVDTCGAGDAYLAAFVVKRSSVYANIWAAISTKYIGTVVPSKGETLAIS